MVGGLADDSLRHGFLRMEVFLGGWQAVAVFDLFLAMLFCKFHAKRKVGKKAFFSLFSAFSPSLESVLLAGYHE